MQTILKVVQIFSAYVHGNAKSRHCAYVCTILMVAWIFSAFYFETPILAIMGICAQSNRGMDFLYGNAEALNKKMCMYAWEFFCLRTRNLKTSRICKTGVSVTVRCQTL